MTSRVPRVRLALVATSVAVLSAGLIEAAFLTVATSRLVTDSTGGKNQDPSVDKSGGLIVFTSNVDHEKLSGATFSPPDTFDFDHNGNSFTPVGATHPNPSCTNCTAGNSGVGNLYLWRAKKKGADPANSFKQLTFSTLGGFAANAKPDLNQKGTSVAWDSDQDPTGGNADGNREIFLMPISGSPITQVTSTTGNGDAANRNVNQSDDGKLLVFESTIDYAAAACKLTDGTSPCGNPDGNVEVMLYRKATNDFVQITQTTGGGSSANLRPRISNDGRFIAFQSTRDFAGTLPGGATCTLLDGTSACDNADGNGDIMMYDLKENAFTQITKTAPGGGCSGTTANERVEISIEDTIADEDVAISITHEGYIKRTPMTVYRSQKRGGRGRVGMKTKEEDFVENLFIASTHSYVLIFTNRGRLYWLKVHEIPDVGPGAEGACARTPKTHRPDGVVVAPVQQLRHQVIDEVGGDGVERVWPVEHDMPHSPGNGEAHGVSAPVPRPEGGIGQRKGNPLIAWEVFRCAQGVVGIGRESWPVAHASSAIRAASLEREGMSRRR